MKNTGLFRALRERLVGVKSNESIRHPRADAWDAAAREHEAARALVNGALAEYVATHPDDPDGALFRWGE